MKRTIARAFAATVLVLASAGCQKHPGSSAGPSAPESPAGEAWLTPDQVRDGKIVVAPLTEHDIDDTILTSGRITFDDVRVAHIFSPVTGRVTRIEAKLGERVKKGDVLAVLQSPDLSSATSDLGKADADLIAAEHDYKRKKELFEAHAASRADFESAEDNFRKAKAEKERALQKKRIFGTGGPADVVSDGYALISPIDGEVIARNINPGVEVQGQYGGGTAVELFTVGELDLVWIIADVYEIDLPRVKVGSKVNVKVVAYPNRVFEGRVDWVSGMLDPVSRTAKVRCTFDNTERLLKPEMYATVEISVDQTRALAIPRSAVLRLGTQTVIFVQQGKTPDGRIRFDRLPVDVDEGEGSPWLQIMHGPPAGTPIVVSGAILLSSLL